MYGVCLYVCICGNILQILCTCMCVLCETVLANLIHWWWPTETLQFFSLLPSSVRKVENSLMVKEREELNFGFLLLKPQWCWWTAQKDGTATDKRDKHHLFTFCPAVKKYFNHRTQIHCYRTLEQHLGEKIEPWTLNPLEMKILTS